MIQMEFLLPQPRARKRDPETSQRAAQRAASVTPSHRNKIAAALRSGPATVRELEARTGLMAHAIGKRMVELQRLGIVELTGTERDGMREWRLA